MIGRFYIGTKRFLFMDIDGLKRKCMDTFDRKAGLALHTAMMRVARMDFCVATSWDAHEVSVSRSCNSRGRVLRFSDDYEHLVMPGGGMIPF